MSRVFIHNNNLCEDFENRELYAQNIEVDKYISSNLLDKVKAANPDIIFIKDALTEQYIDLLGLRVAMHIRLSTGKLKYLPIVIVSELSHIILQKLSPLAKILITKNIFLIKNTKEAINNFDETLIKPFEGNEYYEKFLNLIEIEPPKDYLSHHSIANEWSIYKWGKALSLSTDNIKENNETINHLLYFKYLVAKDYSDDIDFEKLKTKFQNAGRIVSIDDELDNGWRDIFKSIFKYNKKITFQSLNYDYKDKGYWAVKMKVLKFIEDHNPDVVLLDLRLVQADHEEERDIEDISGIKILQEIHKINAGIQVIMLTATGKSTILEKLYEYNILGYIKKEHPDDKDLNTKENIEKLMHLVDQGFQKSYLKEISLTQKKILELNIMKNALLTLDGDNQMVEIKNSIPQVFDILNSNIPKGFVYSTFVIFKCLESIVKFYMYEKYFNGRYEAFWRDSDQQLPNGSSIEKRLKAILNQKLNLRDLDKRIEEIVGCRNYLIHPKDSERYQNNILITSPNEVNIKEWLNMLSSILKSMDF